MTSSTTLQGIIASISNSYALTVANNGGTAGVFGYNRLEVTNPGSISPIGTLKGVTIEVIRSSNVSEDLLISLAGTRAQSFWRRVVILSTAGTWRSFGSADATSFSAGVTTLWSYGTGSSPVFTSTTSPRGVIFFV